MITQKEVRELFEYRDGKLYWQNPPTGTIVKRGDRAGCRHSQPHYWTIKIAQKKYLEHRLIFLFHNGFMPREIDHIRDALTLEGIKNNSINNLQVIDHSLNIQKSCLARGQSKYRGIYWRQDGKKWQGQINYKGKKHYLGCFSTEEAGARAYDAAASSFFGKGCFLNFPT